MLAARQGDAAGHGAAEHLVTRDGDRIDGFAEGNLGREVDKLAVCGAGERSEE